MRFRPENSPDMLQQLTSQLLKLVSKTWELYVCSATAFDASGLIPAACNANTMTVRPQAWTLLKTA